MFVLVQSMFTGVDMWSLIASRDGSDLTDAEAYMAALYWAGMTLTTIGCASACVQLNHVRARLPVGPPVRRVNSGARC